MILYDETGVLVGIGAADEETVERARAAAWLDGYRVGKEAGRQEMHGDWIVAVVILACFAVIVFGWRA